MIHKIDRYVIVYCLHLVKIHSMLFIGQQLNHAVNIVLENYFFGLLLLLFIVVSYILINEV